MVNQPHIYKGNYKNQPPEQRPPSKERDFTDPVTRYIFIRQAEVRGYRLLAEYKLYLKYCKEHHIVGSIQNFLKERVGR